jgi:hypothetical protein|nr:MAG TPA: hypothetical protein [Caudoviricetes sp.]
MEVIISILVSLTISTIAISIHMKLLEQRINKLLEQQEKDFYDYLNNVEEIVIEVLKKRNNL